MIEPSLLDELICHISSLASVYHRPPSSFVAGKTPVRRAVLPRRTGSDAGEVEEVSNDTPTPTLSQVAGVPPVTQTTQAPTTDNLLGDLLMDMGPAPTPAQPPVYNAPPQSQAPSLYILIFYFNLL